MHRQIKLVIGKTPQALPCLHLLMVPSLHLLITDKLLNPYTYPPGAHFPTCTQDSPEQTPWMLHASLSECLIAGEVHFLSLFHSYPVSIKYIKTSDIWRIQWNFFHPILVVSMDPGGRGMIIEQVHPDRLSLYALRVLTNKMARFSK